MKPDIVLVQQLIVKDFQLEDQSPDISDLEKLRNWLAQQIVVLLDRDFQQFLNLLYRVDVNENKVKQAFAGDNPIYELAGLIIERELLKVETRKRYSS